MRRCGGRLRAVPMVALLAGLATLNPAAASAAEQPAFRLRDDAIEESSGLVVSRTRPGLAYTVNDSGDSARVFTVDMSSGRVVGETLLAGVDPVDIEALAFAPAGRLLVGDIGDNTATRTGVEVHVIAEPAPGDRVVRPRTTRLVYADGARDAEALLVRDGRLFVVSKRILSGVVYRGPRVGGLGTTARLRPVADAPGVVTDATVLADGRALLRNYTTAFVVGADWSVRQTLPLPRMPQGETLAAAPTGRSVYAGTEGSRSPVYRIEVLRPRPTIRPTTRPTTAPSPTASSPGEVSPRASESAEATPRRSESAERGTEVAVWVGGGALVALLGVLVARRSRHRS